MIVLRVSLCMCQQNKTTMVLLAIVVTECAVTALHALVTNSNLLCRQVDLPAVVSVSFREYYLFKRAP
jgi:hypothetical protein